MKQWAGRSIDFLYRDGRFASRSAATESSVPFCCGRSTLVLRLALIAALLQ